MVLTKVTRFDSVPLNATYFTDEGYLIDHPIVTTCGIFEYTNKDGSTRKELRLPEEVFARKSLESYKGKPVIITHNAGVVNKDNVADEIIGTILGNGYKDGKDVRAEIIIHETEKLRSCGLRALSLGYNLELDETPGEWHGEHYDAIQRNIEINHLALVAEARAGDNARLNLDKKDKNGGEKMGRKHRRSDGEPMDPVVLEEAINAFKARKETEENEQAKQDAAKKRFGFFRKKKDGEDLAKKVPDETVEVEKDVEFEKEPPTVEERVDSVKRRRDKRDEQDEPRDTRAAMEMIAEQDEDIDELLKIIEEMSAKKNQDADDFEDDVPEDLTENEEEDYSEFEDAEEEEDDFDEDEDETEIEEDVEDEETYPDEEEEPDEDEEEESEDEEDEEFEEDEDEEVEFEEEEEEEPAEEEKPVPFKKDKKHCDNSRALKQNLNLDSANRYVKAKIDVCRTADLLNMNVDNMTVKAARKAIVKKMNPGVRLDGKSDSYISAMYDVAKSQAKKRRGTDYQRRQMFNGDSKNSVQRMTGAEKARNKMIKKMGESK